MTNDQTNWQMNKVKTWGQSKNYSKEKKMVF